jgi:RNA polymerase sigma factor (sigma-70 family)
MSFDLRPQQDSLLTPEALEKMLIWLDTDRERAEEKYLQIRAKLSEVFESNGCKMVSGLTDEAVIHVIKKIRKTGASASDLGPLCQKAGEKVLRNYFKRWASTKEAFDRLLNWLDADKEAAGKKYDQIHMALSTIFRVKGFADAEGLADETINRVIRKLPKIEKNYSGNPAYYFSGVAKRICQETLRQNRLAEKTYMAFGQRRQPDDLSYQILQGQDEDQQRICFHQCMQGMKANERELLLAYYEEDKREKINARKDLATSFGITPGNLRVRRYRIYNSLVKCIKKCWQEKQASNFSHDPPARKGWP